MKLRGNIYLTPWTSDDTRFKEYWWHGTSFAYRPMSHYDYHNLKLKIY